MQFDFFGVSEYPPIYDLIAQGALFVVNHSGGKDSQVMFLRLRALERRINHAFIIPQKGQLPQFLEEITGIAARVRGEKRFG